MNMNGNDLSVLQVIDTLEIGPAVLEKKRLRAPYRLVQNGRTETMDLIYTYEEEVFPRHDAALPNLAAMIAAQVGMNYGLFCKEIIFHGPLDAADRHFITQMTRNTAREILVNKFLLPNHFMIGAAANLEPIPREEYLQAALKFPEAGEADLPPWDLDPSRHTVLSSGGKDSLLSFGAMRELGFETHPIFINESGRHWYTALNSYRHFKAVYPETARVWFNADRLFNWMVRHMPFVRQDFQNIRSDEYPIRLWTVAAYLFGALPILRKRRISRLLIGDEYDTTRQVSYKGILHYDGVFDQSLFFDQALTRYFHRKQWGIDQFSVIRPLSELLIEKILVERYPDLQKHQVSCHATHKDAERVKPCGRCEKCRRIIGMLAALGADATACGYTTAQMEAGLQALLSVTLRQEAEGAQHMLHLLGQRGLVPPDAGQERPQVLKLRFDGISPINAIPADLRRPLFELYLEHAAGAVKMTNGEWLDFDPLADPDLLLPFPVDGKFAEVQPDPTLL